MAKKQSKQGNTKGSKKEIQVLSEKAKLATEAGDYLLAREINSKIIRLGDSGEAVLAAQLQNERLGFDPFLLKFACGVIAIYGAGWLVAFFH